MFYLSPYHEQCYGHSSFNAILWAGRNLKCYKKNCFKLGLIYSTKWVNQGLKNARVRQKNMLQENRVKGGAPVSYYKPTFLGSLGNNPLEIFEISLKIEF